MMNQDLPLIHHSSFLTHHSVLAACAGYAGRRRSANANPVKCNFVGKATGDEEKKGKGTGRPDRSASAPGRALPAPTRAPPLEAGSATTPSATVSARRTTPC